MDASLIKGTELATSHPHRCWSYAITTETVICHEPLAHCVCRVSQTIGHDLTLLGRKRMRKLATVRTISQITPIPDADRIELAVVDGWKCVIKKGEFAVGDRVIYCEIDSFLPIRTEFEFLRSSSFKRMDEREGFRLRTVKLRGQISQGLLLPTSILSGDTELGQDVSEQLGIVKYEPPVPASLAGEVIGPFPSSITKTDEERIQNLASDYESFRGKEFFVSEKLDGTSFTAFYDQDFGVCGRNWQYAPSDQNTLWRVAKSLELEKKLSSMDRRIAIQGELVGPGIQGNKYKLKEHRLFVFNVFDIDQYAYVEKDAMALLCDRLELEQVPLIELRSVPDTIDEILECAEGKSVLNSTTDREGLVWVHGSGQNRISFKTISNSFLVDDRDSH